MTTAAATATLNWQRTTRNYNETPPLQFAITNNQEQNPSASLPMTCCTDLWAVILNGVKNLLCVAV